MANNIQRAKGFINIAQLIVIAVALFGVGALYLLRTPGKDADTDITPRDKNIDIPPPLVVTDANFSQIFSTLKRIDGVDSVYSPRVEGVYSPEEAIRGALQLHNRFIEVRGAVTMAGRQPPQIQRPGDSVWMPSIGPAFVTSSGTIVLNNPSGLSNVTGFEQFVLRGIFRVTTTNGAPTEYYLAIPPLCENCVNVLRSQINSASCTADADCKLIYSSCDCEAVPASDPRTELPSTTMCVQNNCTNSVRTAKAVCVQNRCARRLTPTSQKDKSSENSLSAAQTTFRLTSARTAYAGGESIQFVLQPLQGFERLENHWFVLPKPTGVRIILTKPDGTTLQQERQLSNISMPRPCPGGDYDSCMTDPFLPPIELVFSGITAVQNGVTVLKKAPPDTRTNGVYILRAEFTESGYAAEAFAFTFENLPPLFIGAPIFGHYAFGDDYTSFKASLTDWKDSTERIEIVVAQELINTEKVLRGGYHIGEPGLYPYLYINFLVNVAEKISIGNDTVFQIKGPGNTFLAWPSGRFFIGFWDEDYTPPQLMPLVRQYLAKYPSSLR